MPGTLFVVATPIGNLEDITYRAVRILREVDFIAAEDTRRTAKLLARYDISRPLLSLREHNEAREAPRIIGRLMSGESAALVTDAGTPGIADPGARLVREARAGGLTVIPIPGPSAVPAALSVSGFEGTEFVFLGFPPPSGAARKAWLENLASEPRMVVFFEAPHRIAKTLDEMAVFVDRPISINREMSKINEEYVIQPIATSSGVREQGEFVVVVSGNRTTSSDGERIHVAGELFWLITENGSGSEAKLVEVLARALDVQETRLRNTIRKERIARKRSTGGQS